MRECHFIKINKYTKNKRLHILILFLKFHLKLIFLFIRVTPTHRLKINTNNREYKKSSEDGPLNFLVCLNLILFIENIYIFFK